MSDPIGATPTVTTMETPEEIAYELRAQEGAIWTGGRLLIGIVTFIFASLAFAYFYLRSTNSDDLWRLGTHPANAPSAIGAAIFTVAVAGSLLNAFGTYRLRKGAAVDWEVSGWTTVGALLLAAGLQIFELTRLPFFPGSSGYASTFVGWAVLNTGLLLASAYWVETLLARAIRLRRAVAEDGGPARSTAPPARLFRASLEGCTQFLIFAAVVELLFWLLFYVAS